MIIGMTGKKQHGKDTFARMLIENKETTRQYACMGFADPLRKIGEVLGFTSHQMYTFKDEINYLHNKSWRQAAQFIGTDLLRDQYNKDIWINLAKNTIVSHPEISFIITDVRYDNEALLIKVLGGKIIKVVRPLESSDNHKSEHGIQAILVDYTIKNNGSLRNLEKHAQKLVKELGI